MRYRSICRCRLVGSVLAHQQTPVCARSPASSAPARTAPRHIFGGGTHKSRIRLRLYIWLDAGMLRECPHHSADAKIPTIYRYLR